MLILNIHLDYPDDAIVLYQAEDIVVYQSKQKTVELQAADGGESEVSPMAMYYNGVWIDAGKWASGSFNVKNPHTLLLTTNGTLKLESDNPNAEVNIIVSGNASPISNVTIRPADGEVFFSSSNNAQEYVVWYNVWSTNNTAGMRVNCWLY